MDQHLALGACIPQIAPPGPPGKSLLRSPLPSSLPPRPPPQQLVGGSWPPELRSPLPHGRAHSKDDLNARLHSPGRFAPSQTQFALQLHPVATSVFLLHIQLKFERRFVVMSNSSLGIGEIGENSSDPTLYGVCTAFL